MSNALFKKALERITVFPPVPQLGPIRRLVRRTGTRIVYNEYVSIRIVGSQAYIQLVRYPMGRETQDYYEWLIENPPAQVQRSPIVTPIPPAWDATARSGIAVVSPMAAEWTVGPGNVDLIVGLATFDGQPQVPPAAPSGDAAADAINNARLAAELRATVLHGFRIVGGAAYVHTNAPPEFGLVSIEQRYPSLPIEPSSVCRIEYARGVVRYLVDGVVMATGPAYVHEGQAVHMRAALYGTGDFVEDPSLLAIPATGDAEMTTAPVGIRASAGARGGDATLNFALWANGARLTGMRATLPPLWAIGGRTSTGALVHISPFVVWGYGVQGNAGGGGATIGPVMIKGGDYGEADINLGLFAFARQEIPPYLDGHFGFGSQIEASFDPRQHAGAYANAGFGCTMEATLNTNGRMPATMGIRTGSKANFVRFARLEAALGISAAAAAERIFDVALVTEMGAGSAVAGVLILSARIDSGIGVAVGLDHQRITDAVIATGLGVDFEQAVQGVYSETLRAVLGVGLLGVRDASDFLVWSVERGGASAAYSGFAFNSFARLGGRIFAASDTGLYELGGQDDNGTPIAAWIDLGKRNFGSSMLKGISNAYLSTSSDGKMVVRVTTPEGKSYSYRARSADQAMQTQRVDFGRGLRATYLNLEITNDGGGDFDLERMEFIVNESTRRI